MLTRIFDTITMIAPAQIANFGGLFDRAGKLCRQPPLGIEDTEGGPGNWMQIKRLPGRKGHIELELYLRQCDATGFWEKPVEFTALMDELKHHPERDLIRILSHKTLDEISQTTSKPVDDGLSIQVVLHTPNGKTGLGLGGSASSAAIVMGIDALYGSPIANTPQGQMQLLKLAGEGEGVAAGRVFYDNVAPLIVKGDMVYITPGYDAEGCPIVQPMKCPAELHVVTITPEFAMSTSHMTQALKDKTVGWQIAEHSGDHKMEFMRGLLTDDLDLMIRNTRNLVTEPIRGALIQGFSTAREIVEDMNATYDSRPEFAIGISGSGPTMYVMSRSLQSADQIGEEIHRALHEKDGIYSWWFCHTTNPNGAEVIGRTFQTAT
ncbi:MAG: hypothetical protein AAF512_04530 [Pseudomonadota bacterium]